jgi:hypothetical protein
MAVKDPAPKDVELVVDAISVDPEVVETHKGLKFTEDNVPELAVDAHGINRVVSTGVKDGWEPNDGAPDAIAVVSAALREDTH